MSKTLLYNAKIYVDRGVFAEAVYQEDGIIEAVGTNEEVMAKAAEDAEKIDCGGKTIIPGLNDSHCHAEYLGQLMMLPDLSGVHDKDELVDVLIQYLKDNPDVKSIFSQSFNQDLWTEGKKDFPTKEDLDRISTEIPIITSRSCGHIGIVNSVVLEKMGITGDTKIEGGKIFLDEKGEPTGILAEAAIMQAWNALPALTKEDHKLRLVKAMEYGASHGVTTVQSNDPGTVLSDREMAFEMLDEVFAEGKAKTRYTAQIGFLDPEELKEFIAGPRFCTSYCSDWLTMGPLKLLKDGSLGGHTAMRRVDYLDQPGNRGVENVSKDLMYKLVEIADAAGMQVLTHCIGDGAIEQVADCYASFMKEKGKNVNRHGIVHCQLTDTPLLEKLRDNDVLAFYQPVFMRTDMYGIEERIGKEMCYTSNAPKTMKEMGIHCSYGTDSPVEDLNPFVNIYCAVTRKDMAGKPEGGFYPDECVDVETAIDAYTVESAYGEFREDVKGRIKPGFYADMVVLDKDIFTCDPMEIKDILPEMTMVGGKIVYRK